MYRCNASMKKLESALNLYAFKRSNFDTIAQTGYQLALDNLRVGALLDVLMNQN